MEFVYEGVVLSIDLIILALCAKKYLNYKGNIKCLKDAPQLNIDRSLKDYVQKQRDKKVPYVVLRGTVTPIGVPLRSVLSPSVTAVLQVIHLSEHRVARGFAGFWTEQRKLIHISANEMPFQICNNGHGVEIINAFSSAVLDMDVVYDNYEPSSLSFFDHIFGFFFGVRQTGLQTTEVVLRDGSFITAIGELKLDGKTLRLQPSSVGPFCLTTATKSALIKRFEAAKSSMLVKVLVFGTVSMALVGLILRKIYIKKKQERDERKIRESLQNRQRELRVRPRNLNAPSNQMCVVCTTSPIQIIILPCGHVCLCSDCSKKIKVTCPICRGKITKKAAAFIV